MPREYRVLGERKIVLFSPIVTILLFMLLKVHFTT